MNLSEQIVAQARGWVGTRFHHQGRLKQTKNHKGGVDCLGLLVGVADACDLRLSNGIKASSLDEIDYAHYPDTKRLRTKLASVMHEQKIGDMQAGDVALLAIDAQPQHLAIVGEDKNGFTLIHAYAPARKVVEHTLDDFWKQKIVTLFRF